MLTKFIILATIRSIVFQLLLGFLLVKLTAETAKRRAIAAVIALIVAAILDGATPDGWQIEYAFGHPFFFYLFLNGPIALAVLALLLILHRSPKVQDDPFR